MAKVLFSALISDMRNKLNGSVFAKNRGGSYLRTKVTPVNPQTAAQVAARSLLAQFSQSWRTLTEAQRDAWKSVVDQWSTSDVFGSSVTPSGSALYIRLNINVANAGGAALVNPPLPLGANGIGSLEVSASVGDDEIIVTPDFAAVPAGHALYIEATAQMSAGISNANSKFRHVQTVAAAGAAPVDITAAYTAKFGQMVQGQKMFVRARLIRVATGEKSQAQVAKTIVAA
jgi:hypothetical protein